jgi:hypothetical protein
MKVYTTLPKPEDLNEGEYKVLLACAKNIDHNTGIEFGYADEVKVEGLSKHQIAGYISQLSQKRYITIDDECQQMSFMDKSVLQFDNHGFLTVHNYTRKELLEGKRGW